jgi:hypothetical protein
MAAHLARLARKLFGNEKLTPNMREAIVSILFKGKGVRDLCTSHRPVSLTDASIRIIDKVIQLTLNTHIKKVLSGLNISILTHTRRTPGTRRPLYGRSGALLPHTRWRSRCMP